MNKRAYITLSTIKLNYKKNIVLLSTLLIGLKKVLCVYTCVHGGDGVKTEHRDRWKAQEAWATTAHHPVTY